MTIREAQPEDTPEILKVLKASLGESSSRKTEEVWNYKHIHNPFGKSLILLAVENNEIAGVRAFMRWKWQYKERIYSAFRAVDTATHPKYQGKGIFKKLTLQALETAQISGDHFVFNTPNSQSKPGYLKMGWEEIDRIGVKLIPNLPWFKFFNSEDYVQSNNIQNLLSKVSAKNCLKEEIFTHKNKEFLKWRYELNPLQEYDVFKNDQFYIAAYVKNHGKFKEYRVAEILTLDNNAFKNAFQLIKKKASEENVYLISFSAFQDEIAYGINWKGPTLTFRNINLKEAESKFFSKIENWNYSIGDLELF